MKSRTRKAQAESSDASSYQEELSRLEEITDEDIELFLAEKEEAREAGFWNLPTVAGLSMIVFGLGYLLQEFGLYTGFNFGALADMLPWLAGILIILIGFGVLSWKPRQRKKKVKVDAAASLKSAEPVEATVEEVSTRGAKKRLTRSNRKKIAGVCAGIAEYFNIDPTIVRIAFVVATLFGQGSPVVVYIILAIVMPKPEQESSVPRGERVIIVRDNS